MPPNVVDPPMGNDPEGVFNATELKGTASTTQLVPKEAEDNYNLRIFQSTLNLISHIFIGVTAGVLLLHALRNGLPIGATPQHIIICVLGVSIIIRICFRRTERISTFCITFKTAKTYYFLAIIVEYNSTHLIC